MTPDQLQEAGIYLYGPHWKGELARMLGINRSTVGRWVAGIVPITGPAAAAVICLVESKRIRTELLRGSLAEEEEETIS